jgi:uncharacterized UBP type Zn finger protein
LLAGIHVAQLKVLEPVAKPAVDKMTGANLGDHQEVTARERGDELKFVKLHVLARRDSELDEVVRVPRCAVEANEAIGALNVVHGFEI